ncbi:hypothetical protein [Pseudomonas arsenicoxydans]|uniref:Secreted protein n=1 Tax=Pseudomonas arsenicoxydans TaxID=702115 RepID=A0A502HR87_9PSED|nr:hypothetical protein [Pseudomonas arsenicoxydans]TPG76345.1 hypothetical protein EAH78_18465 [Pseudomonas arsenicoxydans]
MKKILFTLLLALTGYQASANVPTVTVVHDDTHAVTCWLSTYNGASAISCLPNSMIEDPDDSDCGTKLGPDSSPASIETSTLCGEVFGL